MVFNISESMKPSSRKSMSRGYSQKSKYEKQREIETFRNAHERGYLKSPTLESIWDNIGKKCNIEEIRYLNMNRIHLHKVKSIDLCSRLRICVLHSNYITNFEALESCPELLLLDLHGNQIVSVPGQRFWVSMYQLQVVYLHDNSLSRMGCISRMAASTSVSVLTLYNTPLSLKPNYRHHVVNSMWSLKALDNYVISDEELIEDAVFHERYSSMEPCFYLPLYVPLSKENTYEEAVRRAYQIVSLVNRIQAKNCPVLIIQKWIRGFLARLRFKFDQDMRIWAAVSIQRFYRHYKGLGEKILSPPLSSSPSRSWHDFDYDTYLSGLKPGTNISPVSSSERLRRNQSSRSVSVVIEPATQVVDEKAEIQDVEDRVNVSPVGEDITSIPSSLPLRISTRVTINLQSLEASTDVAFKGDLLEKRMVCKSDRSSTRETGKSFGFSSHKESWDKRSSSCKIKTKELLREEERIKERERKVKRKSDRVGKYPTVKVFFGPVVESHRDTDTELREEESDLETHTVNFRLTGLKPPIQKVDPIQEVLISKREAAKEIREAAREQEKKVLNEPKKSVTRHSTTSTEQRLFIKTHGTMGLACLHAVQQAYRDRERAESLTTKAEMVSRMRARRELAKDRVKMFKQDYQEDSIRRRIRDGVKTAEALAEHDNKRVLAHQQYANKRTATAERQKSHQADFTFANDFACQQSSVSNALLKHDILAQKEDALHELIEAVRKEKEISQEQQFLVRRYLEHRQLIRQTETATARANLDAAMLEDHNLRVMEAKSRVARQRARTEKVQTLSPISVTRAPPQLPPLGVVAQDQLEVWEKMPKFEWRPRSHERSVPEPTIRNSVFNTTCYSPQRFYGLVEKAS